MLFVTKVSYCTVQFFELSTRIVYVTARSHFVITHNLKAYFLLLVKLNDFKQQTVKNSYKIVFILVQYNWMVDGNKTK